MTNATRLEGGRSKKNRFWPIAVIASLAPHGILDGLLKTLGLLFLILNLKNLPTVWHIRVLRALLHHINLSGTAMSRRDLFRPMVITTYNTPLDCDYNLHKSNSTYFRDLDVARAHYIGALVRTGLRRLKEGDFDGVPAWRGSEDALSPSGSIDKTSGSHIPGNYIVALGGVSCMFRKEIKPLARFEIWTRLLAWDEKWIYTLSHIVKAGAVRPRGYSLQPNRDSDRDGFLSTLLHHAGLRQRSKPHPSRRRPALETAGPSSSSSSAGSDKANAASSSAAIDHEDWSEEMRRAVYASSIARYVCKKGFAVIPPEVLLERSRLLPEQPRPPHVPDLRFGYTFERPSSTPEEKPGSTSPAAYRDDQEGGAAAAAAAGHGQRQQVELTGATWDEVHKMRTAGLKYAMQFDGLAGMHDEFAKDGDEVMGVYGDIFY